MQVGIKIWSMEGESKIRQIADVSDFLEVMVVQKEHLKFLKEINTKFNIHAKHEAFGLNLADKSIRSKNIELIDEAIYTADKLNSDVIVLHCGHLSNSNCSFNEINNVLDMYNDDRFYFENLCNIKRKESYPTHPLHIKELLSRHNSKFCLDFSHAQSISVDSGLGFSNMLKDFSNLNPNYFHICDGKIGLASDLHLNLGDGNFPITDFKKIIGKKPVTLEVNHKSSIISFKKQVEILKC